MKDEGPPRLAEWLLARILPRSDREHALGDLFEEYTEVRRRRGGSEARRWYWGQVPGSVWPSMKRRLSTVGPGSGALRREVRFAARSLSRRPTLLLISATTLGLGIGSATAIFSVTDTILVRPLPYAEGERLATVWNTYDSWRGHEVLGDIWDRIALSWPEYVEWRERQEAFDAIAIYGTRAMTLTEGGDPAEVIVGYASATLHPLLGVRMHLGRTFEPEEVGPGAPRLAVLSYELWRDRYGEDPALVGGSIRLNDMAFEVIGVLQPGFALRSLASFGPRASRHALWLPLGTDGSSLDRGNHSYEALGRLSPGASLRDATAEAKRIIWADAEPGTRGIRVALRKDEEVGDTERPLLLLIAAVGLLLLIACVNVATLFVGESVRRGGELATKAALGAGRARILRQLGLEGALVGSVGTLLGLALAAWGVGILLRLAPAEMALPSTLPLDGRVVMFAAVLGPLVGSAAGLFPGLVMDARGELLRDSRGRVGSTRRARRWQRILVGGQVAVSVVLVVSGALLIRSFVRLRSVDTGFQVRDVVVARVTLPPARYESPELAAAFFHGVVDRLRGSPGAVGVTAASAIPFSGRGGSSSFDLVGRQPPPDAPDPEAHRRTVLPSYHRVMGIPLREGRFLDPSDRIEDAPVIVVSESMARRYWPDGSAVGSRIQRDRREWEIVGVVGDVLFDDLASDPLPTFYVPLDVAEVRNDMMLVVRSDLPPDQVADDIRSAVWSRDDGLPVTDVATASGLVARSATPERFRTLLVASFAILATILSAVGLFGVVARAVTARLPELGVRVALGARTGTLLTHVVRREVPPLAIGLLTGAGGAVLAGGVLSGFLFDVSAQDPLALTSAVVVLGVVGLAAILGAAHRALTVDPVEVIRAE